MLDGIGADVLRDHLRDVTRDATTGDLFPGR
jgi:hypothetical protein